VAEEFDAIQKALEAGQGSSSPQSETEDKNDSPPGGAPEQPGQSEAYVEVGGERFDANRVADLIKRDKERWGDYTRKTQELSEKEKQYGQKIVALESQLSGYTNWEAGLKSNPNAWNEVQAVLDKYSGGSSVEADQTGGNTSIPKEVMDELKALKDQVSQLTQKDKEVTLEAELASVNRIVGETTPEEMDQFKEWAADLQEKTDKVLPLTALARAYEPFFDKLAVAKAKALEEDNKNRSKDKADVPVSKSPGKGAPAPKDKPTADDLLSSGIDRILKEKDA